MVCHGQGEQESYLRRLRGEAKTLLSLEHRPEGQTQRVTKQLLYEQGIRYAAVGAAASETVFSFKLERIVLERCGVKQRGDADPENSLPKAGEAPCTSALVHPTVRNATVPLEMLGFVLLSEQQRRISVNDLWYHVLVHGRRSVRALGALGGLRKYKGHTTRAERMVQIEWAKRANRGLSTALYHLPPCCCLRTGELPPSISASP